MINSKSNLFFHFSFLLFPLACCLLTAKFSSPFSSIKKCRSFFDVIESGVLASHRPCCKLRQRIKDDPGRVSRTRIGSRSSRIKGKTSRGCLLSGVLRRNEWQLQGLTKWIKLGSSKLQKPFPVNRSEVSEVLLWLLSSPSWEVFGPIVKWWKDRQGTIRNNVSTCNPCRVRGLVDTSGCVFKLLVQTQRFLDACRVDCQRCPLNTKLHCLQGS